VRVEWTRQYIGNSRLPVKSPATEAVLDLSDVFREEREPVYLDDCCHLTGLGNRLLGAAVGRALAGAPVFAALPGASR
jgi:hypothetical protein